MNNSFKILLYGIFFISILSRLVLASVNNGAANDPHLEVSKLIFDTNKIPDPDDCWQCYHSKLYHYTVAKLWGVFKLYEEKERYVLAQLLNAIAGILTIFICWRFINRQKFSEQVKLLSFSLIALNPALISINCQASNDTFAILFGTLILYSLYNVFKKSNFINVSLLIAFSILGGVSKTNSIILVAGTILVLLLKIFASKKFSISINKGYLGILLIYILMVIPSIAYFGKHYSNYKKYNDPFVYNTAFMELPPFYKNEDRKRPGIRSVVEGYFTFRIVDLLKNPSTNYDMTNYPLHRTSLWSQLYGRNNFIYFDGCPWQTQNSIILSVGRVSILLALIPSLFFLLSLFKELSIWPKALFKRDMSFLRFSDEWIFHIFIIGFIAFIILFTAFGRDCSFLKIIYVYPGLLAAVIPLLKACSYLYSLIQNNRVLVVLLHTSIVVLLVSYLIPIIDLIVRLWNQ